MKKYNVFSKLWFLTLLLVTFVAGCASNDPEVIPGSDITPPKVSFTSPQNGAVAVPYNMIILVGFSEKMDPLTLNNSTFTVIGPGAAVVPGVVTSAGSSVTFTPINTFIANTTYTATITTGVKDPAGNGLANNYVFTFTTGVTADATAPTVSTTSPVNTAVSVPINNKINIEFSEAMNPVTITPITVRVTGPGVNIVTGTMVSAGTSATFTPTRVLAANTLYSVTVTTGVMDLAGNIMAANYVWSFTTAATLDNTVPTVSSTNPAGLATNVALNSTIDATFSKSMDPLTINSGSFVVTGVSGLVSYDATSRIACFKPAGPLAANTSYTATITNNVTDLSGNALAINKVWSFTTGSAQAILPVVNLSSAVTFGAAGGAGVTSCGNTLINGDVSTTSASTLITGLTDANGLGYDYTIAGCPGIVNGKVYTAPPVPGDAESLAIATIARDDAQIAFDATSTASMPGGITQTAELGGLTLAPGVYWTGTAFAITSVDLTLDAQGDPNASWVFQSASTLTLGVNRKVILINGAQAKNIFWHVSSAATINAGAQMKGTILAFSGVSMGTGARLDGRALSMVGGPVTLLNNIINVPAP